MQMRDPRTAACQRGQGRWFILPTRPYSHLVSIMYLFVLGVVLVRGRIQRDTLPPPPA